jgi:Cdc6-like AAA superfamily ATPase
MQWLSRSDTETEYHVALNRHFENPDSCAWIEATTEYRSWANAESRSSGLWIYSGPGTGKTVLCAALVNKLQSKCLGQQSSAVAYFFCDSKEVAKLDTEGPTRTILCQLLESCQFIPDFLFAEYRKHKQRGIQKFSPTKLNEILEFTVEHFHHVYVIVDGLDEYQIEERTSLLIMLSTLGTSTGNAIVHVLLTSRPECDIERALRNFASVKVRPSDTKSDLKAYIQRSVWSLQRIKEEEVQAIQQLTKKANGM